MKLVYTIGKLCSTKGNSYAICNVPDQYDHWSWALVCQRDTESRIGWIDRGHVDVDIGRDERKDRGASRALRNEWMMGCGFWITSAIRKLSRGE